MLRNFKWLAYSKQTLSAIRFASIYSLQILDYFYKLLLNYGQEIITAH